MAQADADVLKRYDRVKRVVLLACLVNTAQARARDDLAQMLCKRMSGTVKKAKAQLEDIRERQRALSEKLIGNYKAVLTQLAPDAALHAAELAAVGTARQVAVAVTGRDPWPTDTLLVNSPTAKRAAMRTGTATYLVRMVSKRMRR